MKRLGVARGFYENELIVDGEFGPEEGEKVVTKSLDEVGRVGEVFGSVEGPFVSVEGAEEFGELAGEPLYVV